MGVDAVVAPHETETVPLPGRVFVPITHDHETLPLASAVFGTSPCARLSVPSGVR
jgi:hypothetical protein